MTFDLELFLYLFSDINTAYNLKITSQIVIRYYVFLYLHSFYKLSGYKWRLGLAVTALHNKVTIRRAQLVLGWVTVSGFNSRCTTSISVCDQPPRSTQPGHPFVGR